MQPAIVAAIPTAGNRPPRWLRGASARAGTRRGECAIDRGDDLLARVRGLVDAAGGLDCVLVDEAQFLAPDQVWQLARVADDLGQPVMAYGLRTDFRGELFPGSAALLALADDLREVRTICHCGKKATMVIRRDEQGRAITQGAQVQVGGNETYVSLCRRHWREATGN